MGDKSGVNASGSAQAGAGTAPSRRSVLAMAAAVPIVALGLAGRARAEEAGQTCYDPAALPASQKSRRKALGYVDISADAARACKGCAFYTPSETGCGKCQLLSGGPVAAISSCRSFAKKS